MITVRDIQRHEDLPFDQYLKLYGFSHSFFKRERGGVAEDMEVTDNMRLGSLVDAILTDPSAANMMDTLYPAAKAIAAHIKQRFASLLLILSRQIAFTATMVDGDFSVRVKGRLDFLLEKIAVIDLKITQSKDVHALVEFMGYKNQLWGYCKMAQVPDAFLLIYSVPLKQVFILHIDCKSNESAWWTDKITRFGSVTL